MKKLLFGRCTFNFEDMDPTNVWPFGTVLTLLCPFLTTVDIAVSIPLGEACLMELALLSKLEHLEKLSLTLDLDQATTIDTCHLWYVTSLLIVSKKVVLW